ncbi:Cobalamin biosynthesis protein BluB @ 5,6-dimethylbenzimidazole synthase, flavin destructase family [hydrothermal vent metagenome]|uniref:Cobalamin biosynthesis protein BluB @ 5,6-dimethylbenzimidazole synthase, flavin destructase family n=1 Tax=hydrothermal vent metagenome TaxID=652676 RepID=A0A3B0RZE2_9ZZZZ
MSKKTVTNGPRWDQEFHDQFARLLQWRRDVRHFDRRPIDEHILMSCLQQAVIGPSVGNAQPWRMIRVRDEGLRRKIYDNFKAANADELTHYEGQQGASYATLKLSGLDDAPVQISVFVDNATTAGHGLGARTMPETLAYSVVCMMHSLWLLLRSHGIGLGWVSILNPDDLCRDLAVPPGWKFIGHLCIGLPMQISETPELVASGWQERLDMDQFLIER